MNKLRSIKKIVMTRRKLRITTRDKMPLIPSFLAMLCITRIRSQIPISPSRSPTSWNQNSLGLVRRKFIVLFWRRICRCLELGHTAVRCPLLIQRGHWTLFLSRKTPSRCSTNLDKGRASSIKVIFIIIVSFKKMHYVWRNLRVRMNCPSRFGTTNYVSKMTAHLARLLCRQCLHKPSIWEERLLESPNKSKYKDHLTAVAGTHIPRLRMDSLLIRRKSSKRLLIMSGLFHQILGETWKTSYHQNKGSFYLKEMTQASR